MIFFFFFPAHQPPFFCFHHRSASTSCFMLSAKFKMLVGMHRGDIYHVKVSIMRQSCEQIRGDRGRGCGSTVSSRVCLWYWTTDCSLNPCSWICWCSSSNHYLVSGVSVDAAGSVAVGSTFYVNIFRPKLWKCFSCKIKAKLYQHVNYYNTKNNSFLFVC